MMAPWPKEAGVIMASVSAPRATRWAGLGGPCGMDFDEGDARGEGFVLDLAVEFALGPRGETSAHLSASPSALWHPEILEDDHSPLFPRGGDERFGHNVEALADSIPLAPSLATEESAHHPTVVRLPSREPRPTADVRRLHDADFGEGDRHEAGLNALGRDAVKGGLVRVQRNRRRGLVRPRRSLPHDDSDAVRRHREGAEAPRRV